MNLYEKLSNDEISMMNHYIDYYAGDTIHSRVSLEHILSFWNENKQNLYKAFGNQFMVSKEISIKSPIDLVRKQMEELIYLNSTINRWRNAMLNDLYDIDSDVYYKVNEAIFAPKPLAKNAYDGDNFEFKIGETMIRVQNGMKAMKIIAKIAKALKYEDTMEEFRLEHSRILNTATLSGELVLSIHPLDYMTMSDNECDWSSCMSWNDEGCYRRGTVEMMNGKDTVVAYLRSKTPMSIDGYKWSGNKKWRSLIVFDKDFITSIKGYPYLSKDLSEIAIQMLAELATKNLGYSYDNEIYKYSHNTAFETPKGTYTFRFAPYDAMYNDFGACKHHICLGTDYKPVSFFHYVYGGPATCMCCGAIDCDYDNEADLCCMDCNGHCTCWECGDRICEDDAYYDDEGRAYCYYCYHDNFRHDLWNRPDEPVHVDDVYKLYLFDENMNMEKMTSHYKLASVETADYNSRYALVDYLVNPEEQFTHWAHYTNSRGWDKEFQYITPGELTDYGLETLFGITREQVDEYLELVSSTEALNRHLTINGCSYWNMAD